MQKAELFCPKPRIHGADTGDVAAGPIKAGHDAGLDWVCAGHEHDRNCHRCRFGRESRCYAARRGDDGHPPAYQIGRQFRQRIAFAVRPAIFDDNVTSLHVADFRKPFAERRREFRVWFGGTLMEKADHRHLWLLRARRERPRGCRAAKQRDERATLHVWMAPAWQEIIWRAAQRSLAVMCPACWCSPGGLLALMGCANRVLIIRTGSMSR